MFAGPGRTRSGPRVGKSCYRVPRRGGGSCLDGERWHGRPELAASATGTNTLRTLNFSVATGVWQRIKLTETQRRSCMQTHGTYPLRLPPCGATRVQILSAYSAQCSTQPKDGTRARGEGWGCRWGGSGRCRIATQTVVVFLVWSETQRFLQMHEYTPDNYGGDRVLSMQ